MEMAGVAEATMDSDTKLASVSTTDSDPASSLRAAALMTLKSKRRKNPSNTVVSVPVHARPQPTREPMFQLDYGQEDAHSDSISSLPLLHPPDIQKPLPIGIKGLQEPPREEGEISDEEEEPPPSLKNTRDAASQLKKPGSPTSDPESLAPPFQKESFINRDQIHPAIHLPTARAEKPLINRHLPNNLATARPGVLLNLSQYETAKDLILDLLGWGVHPEYLVDCGLSRPTLFHVFNELNLRLPSNLDITGLEPFIPGTTSMLPKIRDSSESINAMSVDDDLQSSHDSDSMDTTPALEAITLEQQRRQELLARKAVLASLKAKKAAVIDAPQAALSGNQALANPVDEFLNSIETTPPVRDVEMASPPSLRERLGSAKTLSDMPRIMPSDLRDIVPESPAFTSSPIECPPSSTDSAATQFTHSSSDGYQTPIEQLSIPRSRQRRPVATDFDDLYTNSRSSTTSNGSALRNGAAFAGLSNHRRCVIDISDSEGDSDGGAPKTKGSIRPSPFPTRAQSAVHTPIVAPTPPLQVQPGRSGSLAQKEIEIQRMKELIAKMEQNRKTTRPLSAKSTSPPLKREEHEILSSPSLTPFTSNPSTPDPTSSSESKTTVAQETKDEVMLDPPQHAARLEMLETSDSMNSRNHDIPPISKTDYPVNDSSNKVLADIDASLGPPLYTSLFRLYPTLAPHKEEISPAQGSDVDVPLQTSSLRTTSPLFVIDSWPSHAPSRPPTPDLKQLRLSVISKNLDPSKRICRFEVPGGGICRDEGCDDLHISRAAGQKGIEPTDEDTAEFLVNALPTSWLTSHNATYPKLHSVLQQIRSKATDLALEQRVAEALATFRPS